MSRSNEPSESVIALARDYYAAMMNADEAGLRRVFDPHCLIIGNWLGAFHCQSLDEFIAGTPRAHQQEGETCCIESLVLVGDTAVVTVGNRCYGFWFTDHLSMLKVDDAWRIVGKTYYAHPRD
jgi:hypothetical protein